MDNKAEEIVKLYDREYEKHSNFRSLWQETANLMFPRENQITSISTPGEDKTKEIYDDTPKMDSQIMSSGLSSALIPSGQRFCGITAKDKQLNKIDRVRRYLSLATDTLHEELFDSNFMLQLNETLRSLIVLGTGCLFSEWDDDRLGLNFKDWDISLYQIIENRNGIVDTILLKFPYTALQAREHFGDRIGEKIKKALEDTKKQNDIFHFIHYVSSRRNRNIKLSDNLNMPFQSFFVDVEDKVIVEEGGYEEFPYSVARWMKSSTEIFGRGQGTEILSTVKTLQKNWRDFIECANKHNNPPREVLSHFDGKVDVRPGALNFVREKGTIRALEQTVLGNFAVTKESLEFLQGIIHKNFYLDVFAPLTEYPTSSRMTTVEIYQRVKQAMSKLAQPVFRIQSELLNPLITRCILLLIRNDKIPRPPAELQGKGFGIEYVGELALALRNQQAKGFMQWAAFLGEMSTMFPDAVDIIDADDAFKRMGESFGVNEEDISSDEEIAEKRRVRQETLAAQQALQLADMAAEGYKKTSKKAEEGSMAEQLVGA